MAAPVRRCEMIVPPDGKRGRDRPKKCLEEVVREDLRVIGLTETWLRIGGCGGIGLRSLSAED